VLGVRSGTSADEIKKAYRQLIKKYHPDVYAKSQPELQHFAHEKAKELNDAYDTLSKLQNGTGSNM
jgi:molecular chaperone DnaJ